ncbi:MAG: hypothetical protein JW818_05785 [Pirellulales bacterium]|nr:hypothetical protein [Pirellulales bacterium]
MGRYQPELSRITFDFISSSHRLPVRFVNRSCTIPSRQHQEKQYKGHKQNYEREYYGFGCRVTEQHLNNIGQRHGNTKAKRYRCKTSRKICNKSTGRSENQESEEHGTHILEEINDRVAFFCYRLMNYVVFVRNEDDVRQTAFDISNSYHLRLLQGSSRANALWFLDET